MRSNKALLTTTLLITTLLTTTLLTTILVAGCAGNNSSSQPPELPRGIARTDSNSPKQDIQIVDIDDMAIEMSEDILPTSSVNEFHEPQVTTKNLCEPIDKRRGHATREQRKEVRSLITKTCSTAGVGKNDCIYFRDIVSLRESTYRWWVRHKLAGDKAAAMASYIRNSTRYGWQVSWSKKDRKKEDLSKVEFTPLEPEQNPYFIDTIRWLFGLGLGAENISNHLVKFDNMAPPEILCDPTINTLIQITIARNAVNNYGADNWYEVQAVYGGRTYRDANGRRRPLTCINGCPPNTSAKDKARAMEADAALGRRCKARGLNCLAKPQLGTRLILKTMTREERYEAAEHIRGTPLPPFDTPPDPNIEPLRPGAESG